MMIKSVYEVIETKDRSVSDDMLMTLTQSALEENFDKVECEFGENMKARSFKARVKTAIFNPIVSIAGVLKVKSAEDKCTVKIDYGFHSNGWFFFTLIFGLFVFWPLLILMIWLWISQKKRSDESMQNIINTLKFKLDSL